MPSPKNFSKEAAVDNKMPETFVNTTKTIATIVPNARTAPMIYNEEEAKKFFVNRAGVPVSVRSQGRYRTIEPGKRIKRS